MPRKIPHTSLAIGHALQCGVEPLRRAAVCHVAAVIRRHRGATRAIAVDLGISTGTYYRWLEWSPDLAREAEKWRGFEASEKST